MAEIQVAELLCKNSGIMPEVGTQVESGVVDSGAAFIRLCSLDGHTRVYVRLHLPTFITANTDD